MTWTLKNRPNPGARIDAEYECPTHGRFTATVERDANGDPPPDVPCPAPAELNCPLEDDRAFELLDEMQCGRTAPWRPSAVRGRVKLGELDQGKIAERPAGNYVLDTRPLADDPTPSGYEKWKNKQRSITRDEQLKRRRAKTGRGGKVFVG